MDIDFKEPSLKLHYMIHDARHGGDRERLRAYLLDKCNIVMYKQMVEKEVLPYNKDDLQKMAERWDETIAALEKEKDEDPENENHIFEVNRRVCEFYAQTMDLERLRNGIADIISSEPSLSLKMDIYLCKIRIAIILDDRNALIESINLATEIYESSCDWDRKNRFKVYLGLYSLIKTDFEKAANLFSEGLASFEATELLDPDHLILYLVFCALLSFPRTELNSKILENSEVRKYQGYTKLAECYYNCDYGNYFKCLLQFIDIFKNDAFIGPFKEHFCKELKIGGYSQLLLSYQSMHLDRMAGVFSVQVEHLEADLRNFINEDRLQCIMDRVDGIVKVVEMKKIDHLQSAVEKGDVILRNIKKNIN